MNNLWESILQDCSKREKALVGNVIMMGNAASGKSEILNSICVHEEEGCLSSSVLSCNYLADSEQTSEGELSAKVTLWSINGDSFDGAAEFVLSSSTHKKCMFVITVDISAPAKECMAALHHWLGVVYRASNEYAAKQSEEDVAALHQQNCRYISTTRQHRGCAMKDFDNALDSDLSTAELELNCGFPILVVATKADLLVTDDLVTSRKHKELHGYFRSICLKANPNPNAEPSATPSPDPVSYSNSTIRSYMLHRLFPDVISFPLLTNMLKDSDENASQWCMPAGVDSTELITLSTGYSLAPGYPTLAELVALTPPASQDNLSGEQEDADAMVTLEDEQIWLQGLFSFIQQAGAAVDSTSATTGTKEDVASDLPIPVPASRTATRRASTRGQPGEQGTVPIVSRRASTRSSVSQGAGKAAGAADSTTTDFFKNLLATSNKK